MGSPTINASAISAKQMEDMIKYLPQYMAAAQKEILPTMQAQYEASKVMSPLQSQLEYDMYSKYGPQFAQVGSDIARQNALAQAGTDLSVVQGAGGQLADALLAAQKRADPEFYKNRELMSSQIQRLYDSLEDPNAGMTPTERMEVERNLARQNLARGTEAPTATSTVADAMAFGQAGQQRKSQKQQAIANALGVGASVSPTMRSGIDVGAAMLNRPIINTGESRLGAPIKSGGESFQSAQNMFNTFGNQQMQAAIGNQNRKTGLDRANETMSSIGSLASGFAT